MTVAVTVLALVVALAAYVLLRDRDGGSARPGTPSSPAGEPSDRPGARPDGARSRGIRTATFVDDLERALRRGDVRAARALAPSASAAAQRRAGALARTVERLGVTGLELRPRAEAPATPDLQRRYGAGTWVSAVQVVWRYAGTDLRPVVSAAELVLVPEGRGAVLAATRAPADQRAPAWLLEPLTVRRQGRVLVAAPEPTTADRLVQQAARAVSAVGRRVPGWRGDLVLEAPRSTATFRATSGLSAAASRSIAAVTTTADGSTLPGSPERVYVNPRVFESLGPAGQQIVLSHETTHVAVGDAVGSVPVWLSEGFADWVALADSPVPVRVLASQVRGLVREQGPPLRLPGRSEFAARNPDLGAAYESAWLAVRLIASTYGEPALLRFRRVAERQRSLERAFQAVLGTSLGAFTQRWRRELAQLSR